MRLRLRAGTLGAGATLPAGYPLLGGHTIAEYFAAASRTAAGTPAIELDVQAPVALDPRLIAAGVYTDALNKALAQLTGNVWQDPPVRDIGVLFTTRSSETRTAGFFGLMFDTGFHGGAYNRVPREGCAVFLDPIRERRAAGDVDEEALFTAIHELGHVFNLWHLNREAEESPSFMRSSARYAAPLGPAAWHFLDGDPPRQHHCEFLRSCDQSDFVRPGGSGYGNRGHAGPVETSAANAPRSRARLQLRINATPRTFWRFEPIELEVELACSGRRRGVRLPNELDAGYHRFEIWIEEPDGHRRRYRPPLHYCAASETLLVSPRKPFRRDISIFGEAGGFTFRHPGPHVLQVLLTLPSGAVLPSNRLELDVRPVERSDSFREAAAFFEREEVARLLFYRSVRSWGKWIDDVEAFRAARSDTTWAPALSYALGRARLREARRFKSRAARARRLRQARDDLERALDHRSISRHRAEVAARLLADDADDG